MLYFYVIFLFYFFILYLYFIFSFYIFILCVYFIFLVLVSFYIFYFIFSFHRYIYIYIFIYLFYFFYNIFFGPDGHLGEFGRSPGPFFLKNVFPQIHFTYCSGRGSGRCRLYISNALRAPSRHRAELGAGN